VSEFDQHYSRVADILGGISVDRVKALVEKTSSGGHLIHGVKRQDRWGLVLAEGVKPLTPELGFASFWSTGIRMFTASNNPQSSLYGFDSGLFHYGSQFLALTNRQLLLKFGITPSPLAEGSMTIRTQVPRRAVAILDLGASGDKSGRGMFTLLETVLQRGYSGGEHIRG